MEQTKRNWNVPNEIFKIDRDSKGDKICFDLFYFLNYNIIYQTFQVERSITKLITFAMNYNTPYKIRRRLLAK